MSDLTWTAKHCQDRSCWHLACSDGTWFSVPTQERAEWMARALNRDHLFGELVAACEGLSTLAEKWNPYSHEDATGHMHYAALVLAKVNAAKIATRDGAPAERMATADLNYASRTWNQPEDGMRADDDERAADKVQPTLTTFAGTISKENLGLCSNHGCEAEATCKYLNMPMCKPCYDEVPF